MSKIFKFFLLGILILPGFVSAQSSSGTTTWCHDFNINLGIGKKGPEVTALQIALNKEGLFNSAYLGGNYFGKITRYAVIKFQEKYSSEILLPVGLTNGSGFVGPLTRSKLNALYGCTNVAPPAPAATPPAPATAPAAAPPAPTPIPPPAPTTAPVPAPPSVTTAPPSVPPSSSVFLNVVEAEESTYTNPQYSFFLDTLNAKFSASGGNVTINKMVLASDDPHANQDIMFIDIERYTTNSGLPKVYQATSSPHYFQPSNTTSGYWLWDVDLTPSRTAGEVWGWNWFFGAASTSTIPATSFYITPQVVLQNSNKIIRIIPYCAHYAEYRVGIMSIDAVVTNSNTPVAVTGLPTSTPLYGHKVGCYPPTHPPPPPPPEQPPAQTPPPSSR